MGSYEEPLDRQSSTLAAPPRPAHAHAVPPAATTITSTMSPSFADTLPTLSDLSQGQRLIVVSNRLPVTIKKNDETGDWDFSMSSGGLVSALSGCKKQMDFTWIGWPGE